MEEKDSESLGPLLRVMLVRGKPGIYTLLFWLQSVTIFAISHSNKEGIIEFNQWDNFYKNKYIFRRHRWMGRGFQKGHKSLSGTAWTGHAGNMASLERLLENWGQSDYEGLWGCWKTEGSLIMKGSEAVLSLLSYHAFLLSCSLRQALPSMSLAFSLLWNEVSRDSLAIQWLTLLTPSAGSLGSVPGQGTRFHKP